MDFEKLTTNTLINKAIPEAHKQVEGAFITVHRVLHAIASVWVTSGDNRYFAKQVNHLVSDMPDGVRRQGLIAWCQKYMGMLFNEDDQVLVAGDMKSKDVDLRAAANERWFTMSPPPPIKAFDFREVMLAQIAKAKKRSEKGLDIDNIDPALILAFEGVLRAEIDPLTATVN